MVLIQCRCAGVNILSRPLRAWQACDVNAGIVSHLQVLHGLWPDFGQIYESAGNPAPYVGFPQWCSGWAILAAILRVSAFQIDAARHRQSTAAVTMCSTACIDRIVDARMHATAVVAWAPHGLMCAACCHPQRCGRLLRLQHPGQAVQPQHPGLQRQLPHLLPVPVRVLPARAEWAVQVPGAPLSIFKSTQKALLAHHVLLWSSAHDELG